MIKRFPLLLLLATSSVVISFPPVNDPVTTAADPMVQLQEAVIEDNTAMKPDNRRGSGRRGIV